MMLTGYPGRMRQCVRTHMHKALYWSGAGRFYVRSRQVAGAIVLMYHSVLRAGSSTWIDPANALWEATFAAQMRFLRQHRRVIGMSDLVSTLNAGRHIQPGTVVITFDDGYLDNLQVAAPILARYALPAILYLPTSYISESRTQWIDELYSCFARRTRNTLELCTQGNPICWDLQNHAQRTQVYAHLNAQLIAASRPQRERLLQTIEAQLQPDAHPPRLTMTWDELRTLIDICPQLEIGAHTSDHLDLTAHPEQAARDQLRQCIGDIQRELGRPPRHFSFPYGRYNAATRQLVQEMGFESAVVAGEDYLIGATSNPFALARIAAPESLTLFRFRTSGACPGLPRLLKGKA